MDQSVSPERDGFRIRQKFNFALPDTSKLDSFTKRKITICNLFVNHQLSIRDIVRVLDETYARVVNILIDQGLIYERRNRPQNSVPVDRRRSFFKHL